MPIDVSYRFDYFAEKDIIQFSFKMGAAPVVAIGLNADAFFALCGGISGTARPFLEEIKRRRAEGIKEDIKVEFDVEEWDKLWGDDKKPEGEDG